MSLSNYLRDGIQYMMTFWHKSSMQYITLFVEFRHIVFMYIQKQMANLYISDFTKPCQISHPIHPIIGSMINSFGTVIWDPFYVLVIFILRKSPLKWGHYIAPITEYMFILYVYIPEWSNGICIISHDDVDHQMEPFFALLVFVGEFTGHRWIPLTEVSDAGLWYFLWSAPK